MLTEDDARRVAQGVVEETQKRFNQELFVQREDTLDSAFGWAFSYNTVAFRQSREAKDGLVGNGPIVVNKVTGVAHKVPTGGMRAWLASYSQTGLPPGVAE